MVLSFIFLVPYTSRDRTVLLAFGHAHVSFSNHIARLRNSTHGPGFGMPFKNFIRLCCFSALNIVMIWMLWEHRKTYRSSYRLFDRPSNSIHREVKNSTLGVSYPQADSSKNLNTKVQLKFEKILVVSAPWRTDRRDSFTLAAGQMGVSVVWIEGIVGSKIDERVFPQGNHRALPLGNLGSWRAHMNAIRRYKHQLAVNLGNV